MSELVFCWISSPIGRLRLAAEADALVEVLFAEREPAASREANEVGTSAVLGAAKEELAAYFAGTLTRFSLPWRTDGTAFQKRVWTALADIPYAKTCSYRELAQAIGAPTAVRAVGGANGRNPLPIILPCHRVIRQGGGIGGYGGGLAIKRWLLAHEQNVAARRCDRAAS